MILKRRFLVSVAALAASPLAATGAQAQTPSGIVSVCSGVSLPRSVITDTLTPVINGIVTPTQNTVNPILNVVGAALPLVPPLSIDAAGLLSTAAAGDPVRLQVLDTNGVVLGAGAPCTAQADSYTLTTPHGVAIGGNGITGLGTNGAPASAGDPDGVAIGNNAFTDATAGGALALGAGARVEPNATGSLAIGPGADATSANSVALGAGSTATRGLPEVSIGAPGAERLLTNVAAGTLPTDGANTGQVNAVAADLATLGGRAVLYDTAGRDLVTLAGAAGTTLTNVAPGALTASSTDAVNGSQLALTNEAVAANTAAIAALGGGGPTPVRYADPSAPTVPNAGAATNDATLVGAAAGAVALHNVAAGTVAPGSTDAVNGGQLAAVSAATANAVTYDTDAAGTRLNGVTLTGGAPGTVALRNVTAGVVAAGSADAVNGGQLAEVSGRVDTNTAAIAALGVTPLHYADPAAPTVPNAGAATNDATLVGAAPGAVGVHNVAAGAVIAGSTDAVNGDQLAAVSGRVDANTTAITNLGTTINNLVTQIGVGTGTGTISPLTYSTAAAPTTPSAVPSNDATLVGAAPGAVALHNVAAGAVAPGSTDAVNGDQLAAVRAASANAVNYDTTAAGVRTNSVTLAGGAAGTVALHNVSAGSLAADSTDAVNGGQLAATNASLAGTQATAATALALGQNAVQYDGGRNSVTFAGATAAPVALHNVAAGTVAAGSTDAVNGGQLAATYTAVTAAQTTATSALALGQNAVQYDSGRNSVTLAGSGTAPVALRNVAAGSVAAGSTDAVNGGQLAATQATATAALAMGQNAVQYDAGRAGVTLNSGGSAAAIHNVAPGTSASDAATVGQLGNSMSGVLAAAEGYMDGKMAAMNFDIRSVRQDANAGSATALAAAGLPQAFTPGANMIAIGGGTYGGESAVAIGISKVIGMHTIVRLSASHDSRGRTGANGGIGFQF